jgi:signal transduction histidine kinase/CheY-like chemotaxis protein
VFPPLFQVTGKLLRIAVSAIVLLLCMAGHASEPPPFALDGPLTATRLEPNVGWFCERGRTLDLAQARQRAFNRIEGRAIMLGFQPGACWFRFRLENRSTATLPLVLQLGYPVLDEVDLFAPGSAIPHVDTGDLQPFFSRPLDTRFYTFPIVISAGAAQEYFLRVASSSSMNVPLILSSRDAFIEHHELEEWISGIGFGITAGLILYHLFLWLAVRERVFRFYVLYIASGFAYLICLNGIGYRLWPDAPDWNSHAQPFFLFNMLATAALFARDYLGPARLRRRDELALRIAAITSAVMAWLQFGLPLAWIYPLQSWLAFPVIFAILIASLSQLRQRASAARIFLTSWLLVIATSLLVALQTMGLFAKLPIMFSLKGMEVAFILQQLLLALALADRLNQLKRERGEQQRAALRAEAESAAKTEFLARMSHEIRTPLNALLGITQLLQDTRLDKTQQSYVDTLFSSGHALMHVINDILDYSKIVAGKVELERQDFSLLDLLDECVQIFSFRAREKSLSLICERSRDLPTWVRGDPGRLRQVLLNLLSNAIKFTESGTVHLRASVMETAEMHVRICFEVEDSGIGIALDKQPLLFSSFTQADVSTSREYGGTGLGLAISRQLVELMQGRISVSSAPGQGSLFRFSVLLEISTMPARQEATTSQKDLRFDGAKALVVEDNPINQIVISGFLAKLGVQATLACSGQEALDMIQREGATHFDVIFMDCEMPQMDGFEATRRLREWERSVQFPPHPIIALTAHALPEHRELCLAAGMDEYLTKPLILPKLAEKLHSVLH